jgi:hypothetical protein
MVNSAFHHLKTKKRFNQQPFPRTETRLNEGGPKPVLFRRATHSKLPRNVGYDAWLFSKLVGEGGRPATKKATPCTLWDHTYSMGDNRLIGP